ncbi:serine/arginine-rich splicing factor 1-like [Saccostrea cucullata]|uniref:serine/arginine-rich splicing factor 1-like n=1 Tax=Saccostrea cuccullata TaxID=36930 RepID=UPI002ED24EE5
MLLRGLLLLSLIGIYLIPGNEGFFDFFGEYRDIMSNCRRDGGYCINPYRMAASEQETEEPAAGAGGANGAAGGRGAGAGRGGRGGPGARGRPPPRRVDFWGVIYENCLSWDYDFGCNRQGGICCYTY